HSLIDWTWFIPATTVIALACAGWLAGRGPLGAAPVGWAPERRRLSTSPLLGLAVVVLSAATVFTVWAMAAPMRSADADANAVSALVRGNAGGALTDGRSAMASNPLAVEPLFLLSKVYSAQGNQAQARTELVKATTVQPSNPAVWMELGSYDLAQHQPVPAVGELQHAQLLHPHSGPIFKLLQQAQAPSQA